VRENNWKSWMELFDSTHEDLKNNITEKYNIVDDKKILEYIILTGKFPKWCSTGLKAQYTRKGFVAKSLSGRHYGVTLTAVDSYGLWTTRPFSEILYNISKICKDKKEWHSIYGLCRHLEYDKNWVIFATNILSGAGILKFRYSYDERNHPSKIFKWKEGAEYNSTTCANSTAHNSNYATKLQEAKT